jgi:SAM-dependent methyltransferase
MVFPGFGPTAGVDLSYSSLCNAARIYQKVALADTALLPFEDNSFDVVVSAEALGHIPGTIKNAVLGEIKRVLRPGGIAIHVIETMGTVRRFAQHLDPELFERHFVQQYGHVGMERPSETIARIEQCGFETVYARSRWSLLWWPRHYLEGFDNEYRQRSCGLNAAIGILAWLDSNRSLPVKVLRNGINTTTGLLAPVADILLPFECGDILYTVFRNSR